MARIFQRRRVWAGMWRIAGHLLARQLVQGVTSAMSSLQASGATQAARGPLQLSSFRGCYSRCSCAYVASVLRIDCNSPYTVAPHSAVMGLLMLERRARAMCQVDMCYAMRSLGLTFSGVSAAKDSAIGSGCRLKEISVFSSCAAYLRWSMSVACVAAPS